MKIEELKALRDRVVCAAKPDRAIDFILLCCQEGHVSPAQHLPAQAIMLRRVIERRYLRMGRHRRIAEIIVEFFKPFRRTHGTRG